MSEVADKTISISSQLYGGKYFPIDLCAKRENQPSQSIPFAIRKTFKLEN